MSLSQAIITATCDHYDIDRDDLCGMSRRRNFVYPRQVAQYLIRNLTDSSFPRIGRMFGRDHTTVLNSIKNVQTRMDTKLAYDLMVITETAKDIHRTEVNAWVFRTRRAKPMGVFARSEMRAA